MQLANMTLEGNRERRYFTAVAGDRNQKGELFGYNNLFPLRKPGQPGLNLTLDILKRVDSVEAGVRMAKDHVSGVRVSESKTATQVRDKEQCLLPGMVTIAHSGGRSVVGNSKAEEHLSKEAQSAVFDMQQHSQDPANYASTKLEGISDESDDVDFQPPTPKTKVLQKTRSSTSPSRSIPLSSAALQESEGEESKLRRRKHFLEMAAKFGFSSSYEFAVHVTNSSTEERETLLEHFYGVKSKKKSRGKSRSKEMYQVTAKEDLSVTQNETLPNGDVQSSRRKRNLPGTLSKDTRTLRTPIKRKSKGLQFQEESLPKKVCPKEGEVEEELPILNEMRSSSSTHLATNAKLTCNFQSDKKSSVALQCPGDSTCLDIEPHNLLDNQLQGHRVNQTKNSDLNTHSQTSITNDIESSHDPNIDSYALIDTLFGDFQPIVPATTSCSTSKAVVYQSSPPASNPCAASVSILGRDKQKLNPDFKSATDTDFNIDELLFGF